MPLRESKTIYFLWNNLVVDDGPAMQRIVKGNAQSDYKVVFQPSARRRSDHEDLFRDADRQEHPRHHHRRPVPDRRSAVPRSARHHGRLAEVALKESSLPATGRASPSMARPTAFRYLYQMAIYYNKDLVSTTRSTSSTTGSSPSTQIKDSRASYPRAPTR